MANFVNKWIRDGGAGPEKDKRRLIVAGACISGAALCILAAPWGLIGTAILGGIAIIKLKNAATDET